MSEASVVCNNIGASILEYIKQQTTPDAPPPRSLLHSLLLQSKEDGRILVKGPHATSLAMNMAHAIASQCHCQQAPCQCFAVAFLTLRSTTTTTASHFPLFCQEEAQDSDDFAVNLRNVENYNPVWNHRALKRIQVLHFRSARDLIAYLLNLQASQRRPWGAIVVDGVDRFVSHGEEKNSISPEEAMHVTQICKSVSYIQFTHRYIASLWRCVATHLFLRDFAILTRIIHFFYLQWLFWQKRVIH
jgi:hypothetical protein